MRADNDVLNKKEDTPGRSQGIFVIRELTKREIKRKYARSYLGIIWSILNPVLQMIVMSLIFSYMFSKSIENYPVYYFTGYIIFDLFATATATAMTALRDNRNLLLRSKLERQTFVLSRVYTALVNFGFSCIAYAIVLIVFRVHVSWTMLLFPVDIFFLLIFSLGVAYALSIWYVFQPDAKNIYGNIIFVCRYFVALFYSVDSLSPVMQQVVRFNPVYTYIKIARDCMIYGQISDWTYWVQMAAWGVGFFVFGRIIFKAKENSVMGRI